MFDKYLCCRHERGIRSDCCSVKDDYLTSMAVCDVK